MPGKIKRRAVTKSIALGSGSVVLVLKCKHERTIRRPIGAKIPKTSVCVKCSETET